MPPVFASWFVDGTFLSGQYGISYPVDSSGPFVLSLEAADSFCSSTQDTTIMVQPAPTAAFSFVTNGLTVTFTNQSTLNNTDGWDFGDGQTSSMTDPVHSYSSDGAYTVCLTVTSADGCVDSVCQQIGPLVGMEDEGEMAVWVFPNPASGDFWIEVPALVEEGEYGLYALDGRKVKSGVLEHGKTRVGTSAMAAGVYVLRVEIEGKRMWRKIICGVNTQV